MPMTRPFKYHGTAYGMNGEYGNAALSCAAAIPAYGDYLMAGKIAANGGKDFLKIAGREEFLPNAPSGPSKTKPMCPNCRSRLTRNRHWSPSKGIEYAKSAPPFSSKIRRFRSSIIGTHSRAISSSQIGPRFRGFSEPRTRT